MTLATSPASSGPAGGHFEGQVGAYYLLSMLIGSEPRGLPDTTTERIALQRGGEGFPLDDVIVHARQVDGISAILEIQVKRSITFAPTDPVFRKVVGQIAAASRKPEFWISRYELAIAIAKTSNKIEDAYQEVLTWAREIGDAATFVERIGRAGSANNDMRAFLRTFKANLAEADSATDDETVWKLLRKLKILVFDFTAQGSASEALARECAVRALEPSATTQAGTLWTTLVELSLRIAAAGGDRTRSTLVEDLRGLPLTGQRRFATSRAALAEASRNALEHIVDRVGGVALGRLEGIARIRGALDQSRYVEIRGDAGVGKSGLLKHLARQLGEQSAVVVLTPGRTTPGGWIAMRSVLQFDGSATDLLADLVTGGGAILFVDNLDLFPEGERRTVIDLVRAAPDVPGLSVVVTARRSFGTDEPSWLPADAIARLGGPTAVTISELADPEVDELRSGAPALAQLLAETHPAREIVRNLYRLGRLASRRGGDPMPRTEVDMAEMWWQAGDGGADAHQRERARLLREMAEAEVRQVSPYDARHASPEVVSSMILGETIRDLGNDRVVFRHDVLREWAIGNLLSTEPGELGRLPLDRPPSAIMARGIELAARYALEREPTADRWGRLLGDLSGDGKHGSWRRSALLALVRSEVAPDLLRKSAPLLFRDQASLLRELVRVIMAVDVRPAEQWFAALGIDATGLPSGLNVPYGPSWGRLMSWLLELGETLPPVAIPEVTDLYVAWAMGMLGLDPITPRLVERIYRWLDVIEVAREATTFRERHEPFGAPIEFNLRTLENNLRAGFLLFCGKIPALAATYLNDLRRRRHREDAVRQILRNSGVIAQAAPVELAELTATALIPSDDDEDDEWHRSELREPFDMLDHAFMPASPAQGPFIALLNSHPQVGLGLVRRLVDHAVAFYSRGQAPGDNEVVVNFPDGPRPFHWVETYRWSRDARGQYGLTSALMALEAWAHARIDRGDNLTTVLRDVLGTSRASAAYLLVAVDLIISHWPASRMEAVPFLGCPELLSLERDRQTLDAMGTFDPYGLGAIQVEPAGQANLASLRVRPSREVPLENLLHTYAFAGPEDARNAIHALLTTAAQRLGPPAANATFRDPALMALYAINRLDRRNYRDVPVTLEDGSQGSGYQYESPPAEADHLAGLHKAARPGEIDFQMQAAILQVFGDPSRASAEFLRGAIAWARAPQAETEGRESRTVRVEAVRLAALLAVRDGDSALRDEHSDWVHSVFDEALRTESDPVHTIRAGIRFNPIATAFAGKIFALRDDHSEPRVRAILEVAANGNGASAHGFGYTLTSLAEMDGRLPRAVLRCGLSACIWERSHWDMPDAEKAELKARQRQRAADVVELELAWLAGRREEPSMPAFPLAAPRVRRHLRLGGRGQVEVQQPETLAPSEEVSSQAGAVWLTQLRGLFQENSRGWLRDIVRSYATWTFSANGIELDDGDDVDRIPMEWNHAYAALVASAIPGLGLSEVSELALTSIVSLPDEAALDYVSDLQKSIDFVYFGSGGIAEPVAVEVRSALADRVMTSRGWKRLADSRSTSFERHLASAIAVLFFNSYNFAGPPTAYLYPAGFDRIDAFLPVLQRLIQGGASLFVAAVTLTLVEISPKPAHVGFVVSSALRWLRSFPDHREFWIEHSIGQRVCAWLERVRTSLPSALATPPTLRADIDQLLAALVSLGVPEARRLEEALAR